MSRQQEEFLPQMSVQSQNHRWRIPLHKVQIQPRAVGVRAAQAFRTGKTRSNMNEPGNQKLAKGLIDGAYVDQGA